MFDEKKLSYFLNESKKLDPQNSIHKIKSAILSSFTINGLAECLQVKSHEKKINCQTYLGEYNQYNQEILNKNSKLYKFSPDITFLLLDTRSLLGEFFYTPYSLSYLERQKLIEKKFDEIKNLVTFFINQTKSKLVITNFNIPSYSPYGIFETKAEDSFHTDIIKLNQNLVNEFTNHDSVFIFDFNSFVNFHGEKNIFDIKQFLFGDIKISLDYIPTLANQLMGYFYASLGLSKRAIVLDLDNTLWGGIIGEDGFNGIKLGDSAQGNSYVEFQKNLLALHQRGILLAINSKNNPDDALEVITKHPNMILKKEHFASMKINWNNKVSNMIDISKELNFGLDYLVFFDDDPVNRELMKSSLPEVLTIDLPSDSSEYSTVLKNMREFDVLKITNEDSKRGQMYLEQKQRHELEDRVTNLDEFLEQLNLKIKIKSADKFSIPRISQLTLKTNQFNLTTKRYQEEEIKNLIESEKIEIVYAQVEDKFGDNGITSVYILNKINPQEWYLDTFLLSCRIMGREIEKCIMQHIISKAKKNGVKKIKADYLPTKKNKPVESFLPDCGFVKENNSWVLDVNEEFKYPDFIEVIDE
jgi:FkbH-like protein